MLSNDPRIRQAIYVTAIVVGIVAILLRPVSPVWADAVENVAAYLAPLVGVAAATNLTAGGDTKLLQSKSDR